MGTKQSVVLLLVAFPASNTGGSQPNPFSLLDLGEKVPVLTGLADVHHFIMSNKEQCIVASLNFSE